MTVGTSSSRRQTLSAVSVALGLDVLGAGSLLLSCGLSDALIASRALADSSVRSGALAGLLLLGLTQLLGLGPLALWFHRRQRSVRGVIYVAASVLLVNALCLGMLAYDLSRLRGIGHETFDRGDGRGG